MSLLTGGDKKVMIDLSKVTYVDSATIGCLMDLYRQTDGGGRRAAAGRRQQARRDDADDDRRAQLPQDVSGRGRGGASSFGGSDHAQASRRHPAPRSCSTATCSPCSRRCITRSRAKELERSFEDMNREINHLIDQLTDDERRALPRREPVPQPGEVRKRQARSRTSEAGDKPSRCRDARCLSCHVPELPATRYRCSWPWEIGVMLCDGRMVCGCADPYAKRVLGDARTHVDRRHLDGRSRVATARRPESRRIELLRRLPAQAADRPGRTAAAARPRTSRRIPQRLYIECTAACNISCNQAICAPETGITRTRQAGMLDFDLFTKVIDEAGPTLGRIDFFNYGEAFLHKRAVEMCEYIKTQVPAHLSLHQHQRPGLHRREGAPAGALGHRRSDVLDRRLVAGELRQVPPARQLRQGDRQHARAARRDARSAAATCRSSTGATSCSSGTTRDEEMGRAREMANEIGVDRLCWEITDHPEDSFSRRFAPDTPDYESIRHEIWDNSGLGNAIPGATPRAEIDVHTVLPDLPFMTRADAPLPLTGARQEPVGASVPRAGRARPPRGPSRRAVDRRATAT